MTCQIISRSKRFDKNFGNVNERKTNIEMKVSPACQARFQNKWAAYAR